MGAPNLRQAIELLDQAVARDPSFFLAHCELVRAHDNLYSLGLDHTPARLALGDTALAAALRLRPDAGERTSHVPDICIVDTATTMGRWLSWRSRGERSRMILVSLS